jgi:anaerobic ribonucleoside-triphosphate reductase
LDELKQELKQLEDELANMIIQQCEVYSRVCGYYRPVSQWNVGQQERWSEQVFYDEGI